MRAIRCSVSALRVAIRNEIALQQEILVLCVLIPLAFFLGASAVERALLIGSWILVIVVEVINSAIETTVNRVGLEEHELSGRAKDLGSAAVFCAILFSMLTWALILLSE